MYEEKLTITTTFDRELIDSYYSFNLNLKKNLKQ